MITTTSPVSITPSALIEIKKILKDKSVSSEYSLRLGVEGGGCSGMSYLLGFDKPKETDQQFEVDGVSPETAHEALRLGAQKLPVKCKFVVRPDYAK